MVAVYMYIVTVRFNHFFCLTMHIKDPYILMMLVLSTNSKFENK